MNGISKESALNTLLSYFPERAVFVPNSARHELEIVSEYTIQEESTTERGHHTLGQVTYQPSGDQCGGECTIK